MLSILAAFGYLAAFVFQVGFCWYFGIPAALIQIGLKDLLNGILGLFGFVLIATLAINLSLLFGAKDTWATLTEVQQRRVVFGLFLLTILAALTLMANVDLTLLVFITVAPLCIGVLTVLILRLWSFCEYLAQKHSGSSDVIGQAKDMLVPLRARTLLICAVGIGISYFAGYWEARTKRSFWTLPQSSLVVLRRYGDDFVCKRFTESPVTYKGGVEIVEVARVSNHALRKRKMEPPPKGNSE